MEDVQRPRDVGGVAAQGIGHRARHRAHGGLVEDHRGAPHRALHALEALEVAADDLEAAVAAREVQVGPAARREIVEDPDAVAFRQQALDHVGADEARASGHEQER